MTGRLPRSTFGLAALASLALGVATILFGLLAYHFSHEALEKQLDHRVAAESANLQAEMAEGGIEAVAAAIARRETGKASDGMEYMLFGPGHRKIAGRLNAQLPGAGWHELLPLRDAQNLHHGIAQALVTPLAAGHTLVVAADRKPIDEIDRTMLIIFATGFGGILLVGGGCAWWLGFIVRRRLERISATAEAIIEGDLGRRIARDAAPNEFDRLGETLNRMLDRNQELVEDIRQVSSDIAHDLRTPLARQKQVLDNALDQERDAATYRETIRVAAEAGQEILELFSALLRISEIDTQQVRATFQPVDLAEVAERVVDAFRADAEASGHHIAWSVSERFEVRGDRRLLTQMLANLVENALLYTPAGTTVRIELARGDGLVRLTVVDDGPGIAAEDRVRILKRFVRLDASRSTPGHGLGMSLVAAIARAHDAGLSIGNADPGLRVSIGLRTHAKGELERP